MAKSKDHKIPKRGSLALLAHGAQGLRAWRKARNAEPEKEEGHAQGS